VGDELRGGGVDEQDRNGVDGEDALDTFQQRVEERTGVEMGQVGSDQLNST
jgi:hypothetical protein